MVLDQSHLIAYIYIYDLKVVYTPIAAHKELVIESNVYNRYE